MKKALITGITGQDGSYLAEFFMVCITFEAKVVVIGLSNGVDMVFIGLEGCW